MVTERELSREIAAGESPDRPVRRMLRSVRAWIEKRPQLRSFYRLGIGALGGAIAATGLLLVPLPGPGWLVVFLGLAILGTEFAWAGRLATSLKRMLHRFWRWWRERKSRRAQ